MDSPRPGTIKKRMVIGLKVTRKHRRSLNDQDYNNMNQSNRSNGDKKRVFDFDMVMKDKAIYFFFTSSGALWKMFNKYGNVVDVSRKLRGIQDARLVINHARLFKDGGIAVNASDFPWFNPMATNSKLRPRPNHVPVNVHNEHSFKDAVLADHLTWLVIEGLLNLARNLIAVKSIVKGFGSILEVGRLDFDSKLLLPIRCLVLMSNMKEISQIMNITLMGVIRRIVTMELQRHLDNEDAFEEEFVGSSSVDIGDSGLETHSHVNLEVERSPVVQSPSDNSGVLGPVIFETYNNNIKGDMHNR
ncbi:hypothetical protein Tco_1276654 [Tanacetum coccineum]